MAKKSFLEENEKSKLDGVLPNNMTNSITAESWRTKPHQQGEESSSDAVDGHSVRQNQDDMYDLNLAKILFIRPDSCFSVTWRSVQSTLAILSSYLYAWFAAFGTDQRTSFWVTFDNDITIFFEAFFTISIIISFMTGYIPEGQSHIVKDHGKIALRYFKTCFPTDFLAWIPFWFFFDNSKEKFTRLFFLLKIPRMFN